MITLKRLMIKFKNHNNNNFIILFLPRSQITSNRTRRDLLILLRDISEELTLLREEQIYKDLKLTTTAMRYYQRIQWLIRIKTTSHKAGKINSVKAKSHLRNKLNPKKMDKVKPILQTQPKEENKSSNTWLS